MTLEVKRVALPVIPYSSWNNSLSKVDGDLCSVACSNGSIVLFDVSLLPEIRVCQQLNLGPIGLERFCHGWSNEGYLVVAHGNFMYLFDRNFELFYQLELSYHGKHVIFDHDIILLATSNGCYMYKFCSNTYQCSLIQHVLQMIPVGLTQISNCGNWIVIGTIDGRLSIWNRKTLKHDTTITLSTARPTSIVFYQNYIVCVCKDATVATIKYSASGGWGELSTVHLKTDSSSGYLSSSFIEIWNEIPIVTILHSSNQVDVMDIETGCIIHKMKFPAHIHLMGMISAGKKILLQDMQAVLYSINWSFIDNLPPPSSLTSCQEVYSGSQGNVILQQQTLTLKSRDVSFDETTIFAPFLPLSKQLDALKSTRRGMSDKELMKIFVHWLDDKSLVLVYGNAVYHYINMNWNLFLVREGILLSADIPGESNFLIILSPGSISLMSLKTKSSVDSTELPRDVQDIVLKMSIKLKVSRQLNEINYILHLDDDSGRNVWNGVFIIEDPITCRN